MSVGVRLILITVSIFSLMVFAALVYAGDDAKPTSCGSAEGGEASAGRDDIHGVKIIDNYGGWKMGTLRIRRSGLRRRWRTPDSVLDPLPGRDAIHKRLTELLGIGSITAPEIGGKYYFYTRREGMQNQPVLYVREGGWTEKSGVACLDVNQLAADGTVALDWYHAFGEWKISGVRDFAERLGDEHAAHP